MASDEVARALQTHVGDGLGDAASANRLRALGPNAVAPSSRRSWVRILASQLKSLVVLLLLAAALIAFFLRETIEAIAILVVIVVNTAIGFITEAKAARALSALRAQTIARAHVVRGGLERELPATSSPATSFFSKPASASSPTVASSRACGFASRRPP